MDVVDAKGSVWLTWSSLFGLEETRGGGGRGDGGSSPPCFLPVTDDAAEDGEGEVDMGDLDCVQGALDELDRAGMPCPCSVSCEQEEFDKTVIVASWPSDLYWVRHVSLDLRRGGADGLLKIFCQASSKSLFRPYIFSCIKNNRFLLLRLSEEPGSLPGLRRRPDEDVPGQVPEPHHQQPRPGQRLLQHQGGEDHHARGKVLGTGVNCNTYISNENEEKTRILFFLR